MTTTKSIELKEVTKTIYQVKFQREQGGEIHVDPCNTMKAALVSINWELQRGGISLGINEVTVTQLEQA